MRRFTNYIAAALLALGVFAFHFEQNTHAQQKAKPRVFYIETQPDSPILIRGLTAQVKQKSPIRSAAEIEVVFLIENRSKKKIKLINYGDRAADGSDDDEQEERGIDGEGLSPGESRTVEFTYPVDGKDIIYRVGAVIFKDETEWKSKPFKAAKAKKSKPVLVDAEDLSIMNAPRRALPREWSTPIFADRVLEIYEPETVTIEGVKIQTKIHTIKPERIAEANECEPTTEQIQEYQEKMEKAAKNAEIQNYVVSVWDYDIEEFTAYEIKGRVFAYAIDFELVDEEGQYRVGVGMQNIYVDETGGGTFKLRCGEDEIGGLKTLPQWVKDLAEKIKFSSGFETF